MTKAPISLQDLRRSYTSRRRLNRPGASGDCTSTSARWRRCSEAYQMAKKNNGAPGIDGVTFEAIEESGVESFLAADPGRTGQQHVSAHAGCGRRRFRRTGATRSASFRFLPSATAWSRGRSSSSWSRSSKPTSNRGRMDTDRSGQRMKRYTEWLEAIVESKTRVIDLDLRAYFDNVQHRSAAGEGGATGAR